MTVQALEAKLYIGGEWLGGRGRPTQPIVDPATAETIGELPLAGAEDLDRALRSAAAAWPAWRNTPAAARGRMLRRGADLIRERCETIARVLTREQGKPLGEALAEVESAAGHVEWMAEEGRRAYGRIVPGPSSGVRQSVLAQPIGVAAAFAPWNFPAITPARKLGASLAAGCCCILKAAEETPATAVALVRALEDAGVPPGVVNLVFGDPAEISRTLIASPDVRKVSFTGSTAVGRELAALAAAHVKPMTMELGGHAPVLVFDDVDVDEVVRLCIAAKFRNAGQICVSPTRFFVHHRIYDRFVGRFASGAGGLRVGPGLEAATEMGPLANARRLAAVSAAVDDLRASGARLCAGGARADGAGYFWQPTVFADVPPAARAMHEEPFGPLALLLPFHDEDEAVDRANALPYGLAAYAFTNDGGRQIRLSERLEAGLVGVNTFVINGPETPWGGVKESGYGRESASEGLAAYLVTKLVAQSGNVH